MVDRPDRPRMVLAGEPFDPPYWAVVDPTAAAPGQSSFPPELRTFYLIEFVADFRTGRPIMSGRGRMVEPRDHWVLAQHIGLAGRPTPFHRRRAARLIADFDGAKLRPDPIIETIGVARVCPGCRERMQAALSRVRVNEFNFAGAHGRARDIEASAGGVGGPPAEACSGCGRFPCSCDMGGC